MKQLRKRITPRKQQKIEAQEEEDDFDGFEGLPSGAKMDVDSDEDADEADGQADEYDSDDGLEVTVSNTGNSKKGQTNWRDSEMFMSYTPRTVNAAEERGYGVHSGGAGSSFVEAARDVTMDLTNDDTAKGFADPTRSKMRWDKKSKKYVSRDNDEDGSKGAKMIRGESGVKIAASFQSGRFDKWKRANRMGKLPHVGEAERPGNTTQLPTGVRYKHKQEKAPKEADKYRDDFEVRKKRVSEARENRVGRFRDGMGSKKELKGVHDIRKAREEKAKKTAKNARPTKKR